MNELPDAEARRRIRDDLDATIVVEAAAGTGKTTELIARAVSLLRSGTTTLDRLVALTFTEKAAGEMKLRLREEIERTRTAVNTAEIERQRLDASLQVLEIARIATIHAFAADVLRQRPVEARIDPTFEVMPEDVQKRYFDEAFESWFQHLLEDPPEGVRRILRRRTQDGGSRGPRASLRSAAWSLAEHRDFDTEWRREPFDRHKAIDEMLELLAELPPIAEVASWRKDPLRENLVAVQRFLEELARRERAVGTRDYDGLEQGLRDLARKAPKSRSWSWTGGRQPLFGPGLTRARVVETRNSVKAALDVLLRQADADLAPRLERELRQMVAMYEELKGAAGRLDFLDLLLRTRDLIKNDAEVRRALQQAFSHILIDEFQDTDPLQVEILLLLAADDSAQTDWTLVRPVRGKLFIVGDPKQSIYRFRRADVVLYEQVKRVLRDRGAEILHLTTSFRSVPSLQAAVNAAFAPVMMADASSTQPEYVALAPLREELKGQPTIVALPVPRPYGEYGYVTNWAIERSLPDAIGAFIRWLLAESGWSVTERGTSSGRVPVAARHVCVLFRRFQGWGDVTRPYVMALEARGIPHVLIGGRSFYEREEVLAVRNAMEAIERPSDELAVFATLRGPLFSITDAALLLFREKVGSLHPLRALDARTLAEPLRETAEALGLLQRLHFGRNRRPVAHTVGRLLAETRAHAGIAVALGGEQALANVLRVMDLARRFEAMGATSFRAFVDNLSEEAEAGAAADAPIVEEGTEGIRIMTVHRAKGLEFPVVILADPTAPLSREKPSRYVDSDRRLWVEPLCGCIPTELLEHWEIELSRDAEEGVRVAYVAVTRARDLLVVPVVGDEERDGWLSVLSPAIYPKAEAKRQQKLAPSCPPFGPDSVLERPERAARVLRDSVAPGCHEPRAGGHTVVWWDPGTLALDKRHEFGLRQQKLLEADDGGTAEEGIRVYSAWQAGREVTLERGSTPTFRVRTATELQPEQKGPTTIAIERTALRRPGRPTGRRFGSLVHGILAAVDLDVHEVDLSDTAASQARLLGAVPEEVSAAIEAVRGALAHPLLKRAAESRDRQRETPVMACLADGTIVEGVLDLAFKEAEEWTVVDFKTEAELAARRAQYQAQVWLYVQALASATGMAVRGVIFAV